MAQQITTASVAITGRTCTAWDSADGVCGAPAVRVSTGYWAHENYASCDDHARRGDLLRNAS